MDTYIGLDVSLREISVCMVDEAGAIQLERTVAADPDAIAALVHAQASSVRRVGMECGPTSVWLWRELARRGLPVICIDARHAKAALSMQINKSDRNDAAGIARIMQTGWYREVQVKSPHSHAIRGLLNSRSLLVKVQRDLENQVRGLLKSAGLIVGRAKDGVFSARTKYLLAAHIDLAAIALPLLEAREAIHQQLVQLERRVRQLAKEHRQTSAFMTVPGVGPMTALAFMATVDDPTRFRRARSVGAYVGLTPRRYASGEVGRPHIQMRRYHATHLLVRSRWCPADARAEMVRTQSVGPSPGQALWHEESSNCRCTQTRDNLTSNVA